MTIRLPKQGQAALAILLQESDEKLNKLFVALSKEKPTFLPQQLADRLSAKVDIPRRDLEEILLLLCHLYTRRLDYDKPVSEFVEELYESAKSYSDPIFKSTVVDAIKTKIERFLSLDYPLGVTAKAYYVMTAHERVFLGTEIMTDMRPVFQSDARETPLAAVITHNLKIEFFNENPDDSKSIVIAMDHRDLSNLKKTVDRAVQKGESIKKLIATDKTIILEP